MVYPDRKQSACWSLEAKVIHEKRHFTVNPTIATSFTTTLASRGGIHCHYYLVARRLDADERCLFLAICQAIATAQNLLWRWEHSVCRRASSDFVLVWLCRRCHSTNGVAQEEHQSVLLVLSTRDLIFQILAHWKHSSLTCFLFWSLCWLMGFPLVCRGVVDLVSLRCFPSAACLIYFREW